MNDAMVVALKQKYVRKCMKRLDSDADNEQAPRCKRQKVTFKSDGLLNFSFDSIFGSGCPYVGQPINLILKLEAWARAGQRYGGLGSAVVEYSTSDQQVLGFHSRLVSSKILTFYH